MKRQIWAFVSDGLKEFYQKRGVINDPEGVHRLITDSRSAGGEAGDSRIQSLYEIYQECFGGIVTLSLWKWTRDGDKLAFKEEFLFVEDFWKLKNPVIYIPIWPEQDNILDYLRWISLKHESDTGYLMLASIEASAIIDVARDKIIRVAPTSYPDSRNNSIRYYIQINPSNGCSLKDESFLFKIQSAFTGSVSRMKFEQFAGNVHWMPFGRYRMFLDPDHEITKLLVKFYEEGNIWKAGKLLSFMQSNNESSLVEIEKIQHQG